MNNLTLGSLFDGSGGFPLGGLISGITPVWASEIEPFPIRVTTRRLPFMKHYGDISQMDGGKIEPVDIITFGSPCTDMSVAGRRAGLDGKQSVLFYQAIRIIKEMRCATNGKYPRYIVWENVPGAFSSNGGEDFKAVLEAVIGITEPDTQVPMPEKNRWPYADCYMGDGWSLGRDTFSQGKNAKFAPTFAYEIARFTVEKDGSLSFSDLLDSEVVERLLQHIYDEGFDIDQSHTEDEDEIDEPTAVCISMPHSLFTDSNLENLKAIVAAKGNLIKKALGTDELPIEVTDTKVSFPWFPALPTPDEMKAYDTFICKLCEMARNQKRVSAKEKATDNEKYAFRCFLLRLGFIGAEYKVERKILLRNLTGSSAFRGGQPKEVEVCE